MIKFLSFMLGSAVLFTSCSHQPTVVKHSDESAKVPLYYNPGSRTPAASDIDWWSATEQQVKNAVCRLKYPTTASEIQDYYNKRSGSSDAEPGSVVVMDFKLTNERPELILALSKLLSPADKYQVIEHQPSSFQNTYQINPSCTKALCAAQKIFGKEVGPQMLFLMEKFDINTSPFSFTSSDAFNASEIADVIRTMELIKPELLPFEFNQKVTKFSRGYTLAIYGSEGGSVLANATITLFDGWSEQSSPMRQYTLYHEIAHNQSDNQFSDFDRSTAWLAISGWQEGKPGDFQSARKTMLKGHPFVSRYGETNPFEDFAESATAYRFNPALLMRKSGDKYNLIKQYVHDGIEYNNSQECRGPSQRLKIQKIVDKNLYKFSPADQENIKKTCGLSFYQSVLGNAPMSFFTSCVDYEAMLIWQKQNLITYEGLVPQALFDSKLRISNISFKALRSELTQQLAPEMAQWLFEASEAASHKMNSQQSNQEYCEKWSALSQQVYPNFKDSDTSHPKRPFRLYDYLPREEAARRVCLNLVQGFTPSSKSTPAAIKNWLKEVTHFNSKSQLAERGITRESLLKYILDRTVH